VRTKARRLVPGNRRCSSRILPCDILRHQGITLAPANNLPTVVNGVSQRQGSMSQTDTIVIVLSCCRQACISRLMAVVRSVRASGPSECKPRSAKRSLGNRGVFDIISKRLNS